MIFASDPGFSATKIAIGSNAVVVPSIVGIGDRNTGQLQMGARRASRPDEIQFSGLSYLVGAHVGNYATPIQSLAVGRLGDAPESRALLYAALAKLLGAGTHRLSNPIVGLPVALLRNDQQARKIMRELKRWLIGGHEFALNGRHTNLLIDGQLTVLPQPAGTYYNWILDDELAPLVSDATARGAVGVLDIGKNTLDAIVVQDGTLIPRWTIGDALGTRVASGALIQKCDGMDEPQADAALRASHPIWGEYSIINEREQALALNVERIADFVERRWDARHNLTALLFTGGGAQLLRKPLAMRFPTAIFVRDAVTANVRGLVKYGRLMGGG